MPVYSQYKNNIIKAVCALLTVLLILICMWMLQKYSQALIQWIDSLGWIAPILFVLFYGLATILFLPTMIFTLAGGAIFGPIFGVLLNLMGASCGAACSFLITRHLAYDWFNRKKGPQMSKLINDVERRGWMCIALLRLIPICPFHLVNYGLGLTGIRFRLYLITTIIFLIPAEIIYTYCGYAGIDALSQSVQVYKKFIMTHTPHTPYQ